MTLHTFGKRVRNIRNRVLINVNRRLGREFVPLQDKILCIETTSICNLKCRFCAYEKKSSERLSMTKDFFADVVRQATAMGLVRYHLTPCTGDVFMDKTLLEKLELLDADPKVEWYDFYTNFTLPSEEDIERLLRVRKLKSMKISIYGHDLESFVAITKSTEKVYRRMLANLETILARLDRVRFQPSIGLRTAYDGGIHGSSDLQLLLKRFKDARVHIHKTRVFNNWGGMITQEDVAGLGIDVTSGDFTYKSGACSLLFTAVQVMATGIVNACACRDVDATLRIGDLHERPLKEILSSSNPAYLQIIREQQEGEFRPVCKSCDFYRSIYRVTRGDRGRGFSTLGAFLEKKDRARTEPAPT